jgi:hypothetical protein
MVRVCDDLPSRVEQFVLVCPRLSHAAESIAATLAVLSYARALL